MPSACRKALLSSLVVERRELSKTKTGQEPRLSVSF